MNTVRHHLEQAEAYLSRAEGYAEVNGPLSRTYSEIANAHANIARVGMETRWVRFDGEDKLETDPLYKDLHESEPEPVEPLTASDG